MRKVFIFFAVVLSIIVLSGCGAKSVLQKNEEETKIKIAWMSPDFGDAIKGMFVENLKKNNLTGEVSRVDAFSYQEFLTLEDFDVAVTNELAAALLLKDNKDWVIIGRTGSFRGAVAVPPKSSIKSISDLRNKVIGGPFGSYRVMVDAGREYGMEPNIDYFLTYIDLEDHRILASDPEATDWKKIDAAVSYDPAISYGEEKKTIRVIYESIIVFPIIAKKSYIQQNPEALVDFFKALDKTLTDFRVSLVKKQRIITEDIELSSTILKKTYGFDLNFNEDSNEPIRFDLNKKEIDVMQSSVDTVFVLPPLEPKINIIDYIDISFIEKALGRKVKEQ